MWRDAYVACSLLKTRINLHLAQGKGFRKAQTRIRVPGFEPQIHHLFICGVTLVKLLNLALYLARRRAMRIKYEYPHKGFSTGLCTK